MNIEWGPLQHGEWIKQVIPDGKEIIGFYCKKNSTSIQKMGFIAWTPNPNALDNDTIAEVNFDSMND